MTKDCILIHKISIKAVLVHQPLVSFANLCAMDAGCSSLRGSTTVLMKE